MRIGFLTPEYPENRKPEGGLGNYIHKNALELMARGHKVTVFVLAVRKGSQMDAGVDVRHVARVRFHWRLKRNRFVAAWLELFELWLNARRMRSAVLSYNRSFLLDIVQTSNYLIPGYFLSHNHCFPLVCRCSSYSPMWRAASGTQRQFPEAIADWMEAHQVIEADAVFAPSEFISRVYEHFEAVRPLVIRTPLDLLTQKRDDVVYRQMVAGKKYLLYFALNGAKGVDVLIQITPGILSKYQDISLLFVGRNDPLPGGIRALDLIKSSLADYWQEGRVLYSPSLPKAQLYPIIQQALGVILPSRVDNYPNTCLEALGLGVPVVGTYGSSLEEMIVDGKTGFLCENGNPEALFRAIERLISLSENQRQQMRTEINSEVMRISKEDRVGQLISFYELVINHSKL